MNAGQAITAGMRADRRRDLHRLTYGPGSSRHMYVMQAWLWWGWNINGNGGLGIPGASFPWAWREPKWCR